MAKKKKKKAKWGKYKNVYFFTGVSPKFLEGKRRKRGKISWLVEAKKKIKKAFAKERESGG